MNTTLIVMRHGNTFNAGDVILRVGSATDLPLTETGLQQGFLAGTLLRERGWVPAAVYAAPLLRTQQSAAKALEALESRVPVTPAEFLTELDYGKDDGRPEEDVVRSLGYAAGGDALAPEAAAELGRAELARWDKEAILPAGWRHLAPRVASLGAAWRDFAAMAVEKYRDRVVLAVTSNGIARFSRAILPEGAPLPEKGLKLSTGALGVFHFDGKEWRCGEWNLRPGR